VIAKYSWVIPGTRQILGRFWVEEVNFVRRESDTHGLVQRYTGSRRRRRVNEVVRDINRHNHFDAVIGGAI
jgi:hypothetical protein